MMQWEKRMVKEEMAKVMCGNDCEECARESAEFYNQTIEEARNNYCLLKNCAKALYNAGYRKLPKDSVVLTREEYEKLKLKIETLRETITWYDNDIKKIHKETAEKIFRELIKRAENISFFDCRMGLNLDELAKQFGVEVEG